MKDKRFRLLPLLLAALLGILAAGCGGRSEEENSLLGRWFDVNSDATLEIGRSRLTLTLGKWTDSHPYTAVTENGFTELRGTGPDGGLGILSPIQVLKDGSLSSYEMIMDGNAHHYLFVREEDMEAMLEIQDLSRDGPREIGSHEIRQFSLTFHNYGASYGLEGWPSGWYSWELEPAEDGGWDLQLRAMGDSYVALSVSARVDEAYLLGLDQRIRELDILQYNGYRKLNRKDRPGWSLNVEYASGEKLELSAGGSAADSCVFDLAGLMEYARPLAEDQLGP